MFLLETFLSQVWKYQNFTCTFVGHKDVFLPTLLRVRVSFKSPATSEVQEKTLLLRLNLKNDVAKVSPKKESHKNIKIKYHTTGLVQTFFEVKIESK